MCFCPSICPSICHAPYLRNRTSSNHNFWYNCVKWWYLQVFFHFFRNFIFWDYRGVKGQKITQNKKWQLHLSRAIPQEQYSPWSLFLVQLCKMMVSPGDFLIFVKFSIFIPRISGTVPHMNVVFGTCVKWWYFQQFFFSFFQNSDFFGFSKFINKCQNEIMRCAPPSSYVCDFSYILFSLKKGVHMECNEIFRSNVNFSY